MSEIVRKENYNNQKPLGPRDKRRRRTNEELRGNKPWEEGRITKKERKIPP
jgi:hypothetical protein